MKIIIKESQYQRLLLENNGDNFYDNFPTILEELLQVPEFREDLKEHSYNKNIHINWWKRAKEDMQVLIRDKYCKLFKQLARKYKFKSEDFNMPLERLLGHSKSGLVRYSDVHCISMKLSFRSKAKCVPLFPKKAKLNQKH